MKKKLALVLMSGAILFSIQSCEKESVTQSQSISTPSYSIQNQSISTISYPFDNQKEILLFSTTVAFDEKLAELISLTEEHDNAFLNTYSMYTNEEIDSIEDFVEHNEYFPLEEFEDLFSFNSLRKKFVVDLEDWLDNEELDGSTTPYDNYANLEQEEMTLLNEDGAVIIDSTIYAFRSDSLYLFEDMDWSAFEDFINSYNSNKAHQYVLFGKENLTLMNIHQVKQC